MKKRMSVLISLSVFLIGLDIQGAQWVGTCDTPKEICAVNFLAFVTKAEEIKLKISGAWKDACNAQPPGPPMEACHQALGVISTEINLALTKMASAHAKFAYISNIVDMRFLSAQNAGVGDPLIMVPWHRVNGWVVGATKDLIQIKRVFLRLFTKINESMTAVAAAFVAANGNLVLKPLASGEITSLEGIGTTLQTVAMPAYNDCTVTALTRICVLAGARWAVGRIINPQPALLKAGGPSLLDVITYGFYFLSIAPDTAVVNFDAAPYKDNRFEWHGDVSERRVGNNFRIERTLDSEATFTTAITDPYDPNDILIPAGTPICVTPHYSIDLPEIELSPTLGCVTIPNGLAVHSQLASGPPDAWTICLEPQGEIILPGQYSGCTFNFDITGSPTEIAGGAMLADSLLIRHVGYGGTWLQSHVNITGKKARPANPCYVWDAGIQGYIYNTGPTCP